MGIPQRLHNISYIAGVLPGVFPAMNAQEMLFNDFMGNPPGVLTMRQDFLRRGFMDPRRDLETECGYPETGSIAADDYRDLDERDPLANRVNRLYPKESWRVTPLVYEIEDPTMLTNFEADWDGIGVQLRSEGSWYQDEEGSTIWDIFQRADICAGIGHYGIILIGIDDGKPLQAPVDGVVQVMTNNWGDCPITEGEEKVLETKTNFGARRRKNPFRPMGEEINYTIPELNSDEKVVLNSWKVERLVVNANGGLPARKRFNDQVNPIQKKNGPNKGFTPGGKPPAGSSLQGNPADAALGGVNPLDTMRGGQPKTPNATQPDDPNFPHKEMYLDPNSPNLLYPNMSQGDATKQLYASGKQRQQGAANPQDLYGAALYGTDKQYGTAPGMPDPAIPYGPMPGTEQQYYGTPLGPTEPPSGQPSKQKRKITFLRVYDESLVQIVRYEWNINNPRFGLPVMYRVTLNDPRQQYAGIGLPLATVFVHWSRIVHIIDNELTSPVFGNPRTLPVMNPLLDARKIRGASAEGYFRMGIPGLTFETHPQLGGDVATNDQQIKDMMEQYWNGIQRGLIGKGGSFKTLSPAVLDPEPFLNVQTETICICLGCPVRVFKGSERGELASSQDDTDWNERCRHREVVFNTPRLICPLIDRFIQMGVLSEPGSGFVQSPDEAQPMGDGTRDGNGDMDDDGDQDGEQSNFFDEDYDEQQADDQRGPGQGMDQRVLPAHRPQGVTDQTPAGELPGKVKTPFPAKADQQEETYPPAPTPKLAPKRAMATPGKSVGLRNRLGPIINKRWEEHTDSNGRKYGVWRVMRLNRVRNAAPSPFQQFGEDEPDDDEAKAPEDESGAGTVMPEVSISTVFETKGGYSVEWPDIESISDKDKATIIQTKTAALAAYNQGQVQSLYPPENYFTDIFGLDEEKVKEITKGGQQAQQQQQDQAQQTADEYGFKPEPPEGFVDPKQQDQEHEQAMAVAKNPGGGGGAPPGFPPKPGGGGFPPKPGGSGGFGGGGFGGPKAPAAPAAPKSPTKPNMLTFMQHSLTGNELFDIVDNDYKEELHPRGEHGRWTEGRGTAVAEHPKTEKPSDEEIEAHRDRIKAEWSAVNGRLYAARDTLAEKSPEALKDMERLKELSHELAELPSPKKPDGLPGDKDTRDMVVIGAGPAGMAAAIMGGADGLSKVTVVEATESVGGQPKFTSRIENLPGFPTGISGAEFTENVHQQALKFGTEFKMNTKVTKLETDKETGLHKITLSDGTTLTARTVIIAGGLSFKQLPFPGDKSKNIIYPTENWVKEVAEKAANRPVVVVGGSNAASQAALGAVGSASHVYVLSRSPIEDKMSEYQVRMLRNNPKITVIEGDEVKSYDGSRGVLHTKDGKALPANCIGIFVGQASDTAWLPKEVARSSEDGKIQVDLRMHTSVPGVFAAGDLRTQSIGRIGASIGDGQVAEASVFPYYEELKEKHGTHTTNMVVNVDRRAEMREAFHKIIDQAWDFDINHPELAPPNVENYSQTQMRDEHGRFAGGGTSLGVKRVNMPQIHRRDLHKLIDYLEEKGVKVTTKTVHSERLHPIQREIVRAKIEAEPELSDKPIIVSKHYHIVDGTHRWVRAQDMGGAKVNVIRIHLPAREALKMVNEFPRAEHSVAAANVFSPDQPRVPAGQPGGGRWGTEGWVSVKSSNIHKVRYDSDSKILEVQFKRKDPKTGKTVGGDIYRYHDVPSQTAQEFVHADMIEGGSHGKYFHNFIRDEYDYEKVSPPPEEK
jgi:thioredoxin reductase